MSIMQESEAKGNPYPLKIEGQGSWSVEDTFLFYLSREDFRLFIGGES